MDDKTKLYVFEKKEVLLIFLFLILISTASFLFGVKIGTNYSFQKSGYSEQDRMNIEMKSDEEELVLDVIKDKTEDKTDYDKIKEVTEKSLKSNLDTEFMEEEKKYNQSDSMKGTATNKIQLKKEEVTSGEEMVKTEPRPSSGNKKKDQLFGKYTIQIGSYRSVKEAEEFAGGYTVLGFNPIIYDINLGPKGTWYRVSLGAFETIGESKDYIVKNKSLFDGSDYVLVKFE